MDGTREYDLAGVDQVMSLVSSQKGYRYNVGIQSRGGIAVDVWRGPLWIH